MCRPKPVLHGSRAKGIGQGKMILTSRTLKIWRQIRSPESLGTLGPISAPVRRLADSISYSNQITNLLSRSNSIRVAGLSAQPTSPNWFVHFVNWFIFNGLNEWIGTTSQYRSLLANRRWAMSSERKYRLARSEALLVRQKGQLRRLCLLLSQE